jgi:hypothetical protein
LNAAAADSELYIKDSTFKNNTAEGMFIGVLAGGAGIRGIVDNARFENNFTGVFAQGESRLSVKNSVFSGGTTGISAMVPQNVAHVNVDGSLISNNSGTGFLAQGSNPGQLIARIARSIVTNNGTGLNNNSSCTGCPFESLGNSLVRGNGTNKLGTITLVTE